jgi:hypothetical protein
MARPKFRKRMARRGKLTTSSDLGVSLKQRSPLHPPTYHPLIVATM